MRGPEFTRRQLLVGGAAAVAGQVLGVSGCGREATYDLSATYDLCVIGSGFAGIPLALRTIEHGMTTIVIEAGRELAASFEFATSGEIAYPISGARQIVDGGTSAHWSGVVSRMWPDNFRISTGCLPPILTGSASGNDRFGFSQHSQDRVFSGIAGNFSQWHPGKAVGFVAHHQLIRPHRLE